MPDGYLVSVGVKADFSDLKAKQADATASVKAAQAAWEEAYAALGKAAEGGSAQAQAALAQYRAALDSALAKQAQLSTSNEAFAATTKAAAAATRDMSRQANVASMEMRVLGGSTLGAARAAGAFAAQSLGLGPIMEAAFPLVGAAAMLMMFYQLGKGVAKFATDAQNLSNELGVGWLTGAFGQLDGLQEEIKQADDELGVLARDADAMRGKGQQLDIEHIRLTEGPKAAYQAQIDQTNRYIQAQRDLLEVTEKSSAADREQVAHYEKYASITHAGEVAYLESKKRVEEYDKQIQSFQQHIDIAQKQVRNWNDEIANLKPPKTAHGGAPQSYTDIAAQKREDGASLGELVLYWEQVVATTGKYHEELLRAQEAFQKEASGKGSIGHAKALGAEPAYLDASRMTEHKETEAEADQRINQAMEEQQRHAASIYESTMKVVELKERLGQISHSKATEEKIAASQTEQDTNVTALQAQQKSIAPMGPTGLDDKTLAEYNRLQDQMTVATQRGALQRQQIEQQETLQNQQKFQQMFQGMYGPLQGFTDYWLTNSYMMGAAFQRMYDQMAMETINVLLKMATKWAAHEALITASHMAGIVTRKGADEVADSQILAMLLAKLGWHIGHDAATTASHVAANTVKTTSDATAVAASTALTSAANVAQTTSYTAVASMGAASAVAPIPVVGPALAVAAASTMSALGAGFTAMAAFANGADYIPRMGAAILHPGEAVATAGENSRISQVISMAQAGAQSGGGGPHFTYAPNINGIDGASVESMARNHASTFKRQMMRELRRSNKI